MWKNSERLKFKTNSMQTCGHVCSSALCITNPISFRFLARKPRTPKRQFLDSKAKTPTFQSKCYFKKLNITIRALGFEQLIRDYMLQDTIPNSKPSIIINHKLSQETTNLPKPQLTHTTIQRKMPIPNQ